jgi:hypothetical protein
MLTHQKRRLLYSVRILRCSMLSSIVENNVEQHRKPSTFLSTLFYAQSDRALVTIDHSTNRELMLGKTT